MRTIITCLIAVLSSLAFYSMKPIDLDLPLPKEQEGKWKHVPGEISLFLGEDGQDAALRFVAEGQELGQPIAFSLDEPANEEEVRAFLLECSNYFEQRGHRRIAVVALGKSLVQQVQGWIAENIAKSSHSTPNLGSVLFGAPAFQVQTDAGAKQASLKVSYVFALPPMHTSRDLRKLWNLALVQYMASQRIKTQGGFCEESKDFSTFLLPQKTMAYHIESSDVQGSFSTFLLAVEEIKQVGFTIGELTAAKQYFLEKIEQLQTDKHPTAQREIASFHAEGFLRNLGLLSYAYFLDSASTLVDSITPVDIAVALQECFVDEKRHILLTANAVESANLELLVRHELSEKQKLTILSVNFPNETELEQPGLTPLDFFYQLPLHDNERELIHKIISTMAKDNVIKLGLKRKSMERKGKKIRQVHPLRFLGQVFSDRYLHQCMREIRTSHFKWNGFIDGMRDRIEEESARGNLLPYVPGFSQLLQVDEKKVAHYIERHDWEGLVKHLL